MPSTSTLGKSSVSKPRPDKKKPPLQCQQCSQSFGKNESAYNTHIQVISLLFSSRPFSTISLLWCVTLLSKELHSFACRYCPLKFTFINGLEEHTTTEHPR